MVKMYAVHMVNGFKEIDKHLRKNGFETVVCLCDFALQPALSVSKTACGLKCFVEHVPGPKNRLNDFFSRTISML